MVAGAIVGVFSSLSAQTNISVKDAYKYVGNRVKVCGKASGSRNDNSRPILIYLGTGSGVNQLNVSINQEDARSFPYKPDEYLTNKNVCVIGKVADQNGKAEIAVSKAENIKIEATGGDIEIRPLTFDGFNRYFEE